MSKVLKTVILLFILASIECKVQLESLKEIISILKKQNINEMSCGDTMVPEVKFNSMFNRYPKQSLHITHSPKFHFQPNNVSEVFCKAAKALENVPSTCQSIRGLRVQIFKLGENINCTVDEDNEVELKSFLHKLRKFSQHINRSQ